MELGILIKVILPLALFIIMLGMGLSLVIDDFKRILKFPKAVCLGIICQMILLPLVAILIIYILNPSPVLAIGFMILAFCPGGTTSNLYSFLAKGDLALSVTLTAIVSLVTPFTIPLFTHMAITSLLGDNKSFELPLLETIIKLMVITVIPVAIGMVLNSKFPTFSKKCENPIKIFSIVFLFLIVAGIMKENWTNMAMFIKQIGPAALSLNIVTMGLGFLIAKIFKLNQKQSITISLEVGIQNGTTALLITGTILANAEMSIAPSIYSLVMFVTGGIFAVMVNRRKSDLI
jgi:BASS family bile acid:Na+ symporter